MKPVTWQNNQHYILYDEAAGNSVSEGWFDPEFWMQNGEITAAGLGRGSAWFISCDDQQFVLRHYRRGGLVARLSDDKYIWTGLENTRPWREWKLLAYIQQCGLPGPIPVAANVTRHGLIYQGDIITRKLDNTISLSSCLLTSALTTAGWQSIGSCIRSFHDHSIYHADLNAHNLLLGDNDQVYLIDFDKGRIDEGTDWHSKNLNRLRRSLDKLTMQEKEFHFNDENWHELESGYSGQAIPAS